MSQAKLDLEHVRRSFNSAACNYDRFAILQHEVESRLLERLDHVREEPARILDAGCGTGIAARELASRYPDATVIALDWAPAMLQVATGRKGAAQVQMLCADMHRIPLPRTSVDLVFTNLAMQWSQDLPALLDEYRRVLRPGGLLMLTCFGPDTLLELRSAWSAADQRPHVNEFPDMHVLGDALVRAGFSEPVLDVDRLTLEYRDVMSLMRELKAIGAHNAARDRERGLTGKARFARVLDAYEEFRNGEIYPATYEVVYGLAFGPQEGQPIRGPEGETATFSVEALRKRGEKS